MKKLLLGAALAGVASLAASAASAATLVDNGGLTWTTYLDWGQTGHTNTPYGTVKLEEVDANDVKVTVKLTSPGMFADNGAAHVMFGFNLKDTPESSVTWVGGLDGSAFPSADVQYFSSATADNTPGGSDYANQPFGHFDNSWQIKTTAPNTLPSPFVFNVHNNSGITFAGLGATYDSTTGQLLTLGSGNHFFSNSDGQVTVNHVAVSPLGGWWFSADTSGTGGCTSDQTCAVAGRDAFAPITSVPEPTTWALMIMGFGGLGAMIRRRRTAAGAVA